MIKAAKSAQEDEDDDDEDEDDEFVIKKEPSSHQKGISLTRSILH